MIEAKNIRKKFDQLEVLKGVDLSIQAGEIISIVGQSGAGKTTLLQILGTLDRADAGEVYIKDTAIHKLKDQELAAFRNQHIGFVFQFHQLLPEFTALENVMIPALIGKRSTAESEKRAKELLDMLNLGDRLEHKPSQLSGGEKQRVAVARALINRPAVVFADEPTGSLDTANKLELQKLFIELRENLQQTFVIVTHDDTLSTLSDRVIYMKDGVIAPDKVF